MPFFIMFGFVHHAWHGIKWRQLSSFPWKHVCDEMEMLHAGKCNKNEIITRWSTRFQTFWTEWTWKVTNFWMRTMGLDPKIVENWSQSGSVELQLWSNFYDDGLHWLWEWAKLLTEWHTSQNWMELVTGEHDATNVWCCWFKPTVWPHWQDHSNATHQQMKDFITIWVVNWCGWIGHGIWGVFSWRHIEVTQKWMHWCHKRGDATSRLINCESSWEHTLINHFMPHDHLMKWTFVSHRKVRKWWFTSNHSVWVNICFGRRLEGWESDERFGSCELVVVWWVVTKDGLLKWCIFNGWCNCNHFYIISASWTGFTQWWKLMTMMMWPDDGNPMANLAIVSCQWQFQDDCIRKGGFCNLLSMSSMSFCGDHNLRIGCSETYHLLFWMNAFGFFSMVFLLRLTLLSEKWSWMPQMPSLHSHFIDHMYCTGNGHGAAKSVKKKHSHGDHWSDQQHDATKGSHHPFFPEVVTSLELHDVVLIVITPIAAIQFLCQWHPNFHIETLVASSSLVASPTVLEVEPNPYIFPSASSISSTRCTHFIGITLGQRWHSNIIPINVWSHWSASKSTQWTHCNALNQVTRGV